MSTAVRSFFLVALFAGIMTMQWNIESDFVTTRYLKNYTEIAAHDASLFLDVQELAQGYYVFYRALDGTYPGRESFEKSLQHHLKLNTDLTPAENSFLQKPVDIVHFAFVDDKTSDTACNQTNPDGYVTFPCTYEVSAYGFQEILHGPSVVAIVETETPRYFLGDPYLIRQGAVYEYVR